MGKLSPPSRAPAPPASRLDHPGGFSLWLRAGLFVLLCVLASRPDRWARPGVSLHDVLLGYLVYAFFGELAMSLLVFLAPLVFGAALVLLLGFDRLVYVPAYRFLRFRRALPALGAFALAVSLEAALAFGLVALARHYYVSGPRPAAANHDAHR